MNKPVPVSIEQTDGRVQMSLSGTLSMHVSTPRCQPLSKIEPHATLVVSGEDNRAEIELDAEAIDALADELHDVQTGDAYE